MLLVTERAWRRRTMPQGPPWRALWVLINADVSSTLVS
jgi:hypothetical protein